MENGPFIDYLPTKMVILQSYVKLLEGKLDGGCKLDVCLHGINQNDGYSIKMGAILRPKITGASFAQGTHKPLRIVDP